VLLNERFEYSFLVFYVFGTILVAKVFGICYIYLCLQERHTDTEHFEK